MAQAVNVPVRNADGPFAEGILNGYIVQSDGVDACVNPWVIGQYITCSDSVKVGMVTYTAPTHDQVWFETNGISGGMVVLDREGQMLCKDPFINFPLRTPYGYVICE